MSEAEARDRERKKRLDDQTEMQASSSASSAAIQQAAKEYRDNRDKFVDELRDLGISGDDAEEIADEFGVETAGVFALANEEEEDYRRHKFLNRNKRERVKSSREPGWLAQRNPEFIQLATGNHRREGQAGTQPLTARERHKMREVFEAKTALHSLAKDGEGLSAVSEITAVTEHRRSTDAEEEDESGGLTSRIFG